MRILVIAIMAIALATTASAQPVIEGDPVPDYVNVVGCDDGTNAAHLQCDASGNLSVGIPASATSIGKAEDAAHTSGDVGVPSLAVRQDTQGTPLAGANGDYSPLLTGQYGALLVDIDADAAGYLSSSIMTKEDYESGSLDGLAKIAVVRDDALAANASVSHDGDYTPMRVDNLGALWIAGAQTEDAASANGDRGLGIFAIRDDILTAGAGVGTDGDYVTLRVDNAGKLWVTSAGETVSITTEIATDTAAYAAGDYINDADTITKFLNATTISGGAVEILEVVVHDGGAEGKNLEAWFLNTSGGSSTFTDNAPFALSDASLRSVACVVPITQHFAAADNGVSIGRPDCIVDLAAGTTLYMALVAREAVTFDAADAIAVTVTLSRK